MYVHSQAPCRIGIAGGGSDLPAWTAENRGLCLSLAIDLHAHACAITRPDRQVVVVYRERHSAAAATEIANGLIRESALMHGWLDGFEVHTMSEVSSMGSGLGVSSAFAVALAAAFARMGRLQRGDQATAETDRMSLARGAWEVEIDRLRRPIGRQDHMAAAHGGLRRYEFHGTQAQIVETFSEADAEWVAAHLVLVRLPSGHDSREILQNARHAAQLAPALQAVDLAMAALAAHDPEALGRAISYSQQSKQMIPGAVPDWLAGVIKRVRDVPGVLGCKVAGAGGGGHLVVARRPESAAGAAIAHALGLAVLRVRPDLQGVRSEGWT